MKPNLKLLVGLGVGTVAYFGAMWLAFGQRRQRDLAGMYPEKSDVHASIIAGTTEVKPYPWLKKEKKSKRTTQTKMCIEPVLPSGSKLVQHTMLIRSEAPSERRVTCSADVADVLRGQESLPQEEMQAVYLNNRNEILGTSLISRGTNKNTMVDPSDVFRPGILAGASRVIAVHNHPSGDPQPSPSDVALTRRLVKSGETLGIQLLDHVVLGKGGNYASMRDLGLLAHKGE